MDSKENAAAPMSAEEEAVGESMTANNDDESVDSQEEAEVQTGAARVGLLDQPLVQQGRRKTHSVQRLQAAAPTPEKKKIEIIPGNGVPLGEIEAIEQGFQRIKGDDLKIVHRLAFGRPGTHYEVKRNLRLFSGFTFGKDDEQYQRKRAGLAKYPLEIIRETCDQLCISHSGKKDDLLDRVMEFLLKPSKSAATGGRKATTPAKKRKRSSSTKKSPGRKQKSKEIADSDDSDDESASPKKKARTTTPKKDKKPEKKTPSKSPSRRKQATPRKTATVASDSDSSDDEPLSKKLRPFPSDDELEESCRSLLSNADLQSVTVKSICLEVYNRYAEHDLSSRKDFLKSTIKEIYGSML